MGRRRRFGREEPTGSAVDRGPDADPESVARTIVLTKLTTRARSRHELADALSQRQVPDDVAAKVLDRFGEVGLVDDAAFAKAWVEARLSSRGLSRRALAVELRRKGVDPDVVAGSVREIDEETEYAAARALVEKKLRSSRTTDPTAKWRQLVGMLARKGYSAALSMRVVADAVREHDAAQEPLDESPAPADELGT